MDPLRRDAILAKIKDETVKLAQNLKDKLEQYRKKKHLNPLLAVIGVSPRRRTCSDGRIPCQLDVCETENVT